LETPSPERQLAPELLSLPESARLLWGDPQDRKEAVEALLPQGGADSIDRVLHALQRIDDAVVAGLRALGLPRGPVAATRIESLGHNWLGRKADSCELLFDDLVLRALPEQERADRTFKTWIHESIHARARARVGVGIERRSWRGFEEGLAEGLARLVLHEKAGMPPLKGAYNYYVEAYETLARALEVDVERLWRECWSYIPGAVRNNFIVAINGCQRRRLTWQSAADVRAHADVVFHTQRITDEPDRGTLLKMWMDVIRYAD
jgi:hypothetical protein